MFYDQIKFIVIAGLLIFSLQSCSDEESLINTEDLSLEAAGGGGLDRGGNGDNPDGQGPNGNNQNGPMAANSVAQLDNSIVLQWTDLFLELDRYALGMRPNSTARALAYIHLAGYETAVPGMRNFNSNESTIPGLNLRGNVNRNGVDWEIALNACYADVMDHFLLNVPASLMAQISALESTIEAELIDGEDEERIEESKEWGASIAAQIIAFSQTDQEAETQILEPQPLSYEPPVGDGFWTYSAEQERALFPYWENVRTFVISPEQTTTITPQAYSEDPNSNYYQQMIEVYESNNSARSEDGEQLWIAEFWSDDVENNTFSPPTRQFAIANQLISEHSLNLEEALHFYLKLGFSLNDAAVATWKYKYQYMVMRPNVFIHEFIDPSFQTNLFRLIPWPNPTFPGYPSGHSAFASAAGGVFINFFGEQANFTDRSHEGRTEFRGEPRSFETFSDMAEENGYSRIPLGVHIRMDCTEGLRLGYEISDAINGYRVRRRNNS